MKVYRISISIALAAVLLVMTACSQSSGENDKKYSPDELQQAKDLVVSEIQALQMEDDLYLPGSANCSIDENENVVRVNVSGNAALVFALRERLKKHPEIVIETPEPAMVPSKRTISSPEESGIEATLLSYDSETQTIGLCWYNKSGHDLEYGHIVALETEIDGVWNAIVSNAAVTPVGYTLEDGKKLEYFGMLTLWGVLPRGHYRYIREFHDVMKGKIYTTAIEFDQE